MQTMKPLILAAALIIGMLPSTSSFTQVSPSIRVNDDAGHADQYQPCVAVSGFGTAVICWLDARDGYETVCGQVFNPKGASAFGNFRADENATPALLSSPDVAINENGRFVIVWQQGPNESADIYGRLFFANGQPATGSFRVNEAAAGVSHRDPAVSMAADGRFLVCWQDSREGSREDIYGQSFGPTGDFIGGNFRVNSDTTSYQLHPKADMNDQGECIVVWQDHRGGGRVRIYGQRYDATGAAIGGDFLVSPEVEQEESCWDPSAAIRNDGRFFVAWSYGGSTDETVFGRAFDSDGSAADCIEISDADGHTGQYHPQAASSADGGWSCAWQTSPGPDNLIRIRRLHANGLPAAESFGVIPALNSALFTSPCLDADDRGIGIAAWLETRDLDDDIRACWFGPGMPMNPVAGSGFDGIVPLSWDPIYGETETRTVEIYRSGDPVMNYTKVADLDLSARPYPKRMLDWIDPKAKNDSTYYYVLGCAGGSRYSDIVSATPRAAGHGLQSAWSHNPVSVDGILNPDEWADATILDISNPAALEPVTLYIKNNADSLCLAVDDPNDTRLDPANLFGFLFDEDNDGIWDPSGMVTEGAMGLAPAGIGYSPYGGDYPESFHAGDLEIPAGVTGEVSTVGGHAQYEMTISLKTSALQEDPGETIGAAFWVYDPGNFYPGRYGNAGEWPAGYLWDAAQALGKLTLASETSVIQTAAIKPAAFSLGQNYPNPFNPSTEIRFDVKEPCRVVLKVYDIGGREVRTLTDEEYGIGRHILHFDASSLPSGIYLYQIQMGNFTAARKMVVME